MKKIFQFLGAAALAVSGLVTSANAAMVSLDYTFSSFNASFDGTVQATGDMQMSIVVDTNTANLGTGFGDFANFYDADVFITSANLGLSNTQIVSDTFLYFGSGAAVAGFTDTVGNFGTIMTAAFGDPLTFGTVNDLSTLVVPQGPLAKTATEFRTANAIVFANGSQFDAGGSQTLLNERNTITVSAVPLPAALPSMAVAFGLFGLFGSRRRKAA